MKYIELLEKCKNVRVKTIQVTSPYHSSYKKFYGDDEIDVPDNIYIEVIKTATKGTIGKLIKIIPERYKVDNAINSYYGTFIIKVEGRARPCKINSAYAKILENYTGPTKYVRAVKQHDKKKEIKSPVNKFGQELHKGDWVIGVGKNKKLRIGRITRYTNSNIWATFVNDYEEVTKNTHNKHKEFMFRTIADTFLIPGDEVKEAITMSLLKGWNGE